MGSKRGVQVQLAIARLRRWNPRPRRLGPVGDARQPARGDAGAARPRRRRDGARPAREEPRHRHPAARSTRAASPGAATSASRCSSRWSRRSRRPSTTLVFVNMRSQAEAWYQLLLEQRPEWAGLVALHHGSLDKEVRDWVELGLKEGTAEGGGRDLVARPRRRLPAGRAGAADRLGQGRRAAAAARRPQRPCARPRQPDHAGADQHARAGRGGGGAARGAGRQHREAGDARQAVRRAGAAPGDGRARRRLSRRRAVRRGRGSPGPTAR